MAKSRQQPDSRDEAIQVRLRLAAIVESSEDAIVGTDMDTIIRDWNNAAVRLYGYSADEIVGKSISILAPPDRTDEIPEILKRMKRGETVQQFETFRRRKDGTRVEVSLTAFPVLDKDGRSIGVSAIYRDITERRQQEAALRESEERFRLAMGNVASGLYTLDQQESVTYVNPAVEVMFGWTSAELLGKKMHDVVHYKHPDGTPFPARDCAALQALQKGIELREHEDMFIHKDGSFVPVVFSASPLRKDGQTVGVVVGIRDDTQRRRSAEAIAGMSRKLLEAQEQERARIARELHDDISQQLALLSVEIQQIKEALPVPAGELRNRLDELDNQASKISTATQSLSHDLHSSRLEHVGLVPAMKSFCKEFGNKHKVQVDFDSEGVPPVVPQEAALSLFRVMQEGLRNASKHSGVRSFQVKLHGSPTEVHLTIRDSGVGFEPESVRDTQGLGLISMEERVRLAKGTISITSRPHSGTEIRVRIPVSGEKRSRSAVG